mmetsp:Transcript_23611/g.33038  ORF Transcript_23611/g.33038 Transcript_23611/m.33038 type:complete len:248 (+) Transcript_23611:171-914(+)
MLHQVGEGSRKTRVLIRCFLVDVVHEVASSLRCLPGLPPWRKRSGTWCWSRWDNWGWWTGVGAWLGRDWSGWGHWRLRLRWVLRGDNLGVRCVWVGDGELDFELLVQLVLDRRLGWLRCCLGLLRRNSLWWYSLRSCLLRNNLRRTLWRDCLLRWNHLRWHSLLWWHPVRREYLWWNSLSRNSLGRHSLWWRSLGRNTLLWWSLRWNSLRRNSLWWHTLRRQFLLPWVIIGCPFVDIVNVVRATLGI